MMYCENCGKRCNDSDEVCLGCGAQLSLEVAEVTVVSLPEPPRPPTPDNRNKVTEVSSDLPKVVEEKIRAIDNTNLYQWRQKTERIKSFLLFQTK